jgi:hypothetical protein
VEFSNIYYASQITWRDKEWHLFWKENVTIENNVYSMFKFNLIKKKILLIVFYSTHINEIVFCSVSNQKWKKILQVTFPIDYILYHNVIKTIIRYRERPNSTCCKSIWSKTATNTTLSKHYNFSHIGHHIVCKDIRRNLHTETDNMLRISSGNPFH